VPLYNHRSLQGNINRGPKSENVHTPTRPLYREAGSLYSSKNLYNQGRQRNQVNMQLNISTNYR
jgi:hypothetical protein